MSKRLGVIIGCKDNTSSWLLYETVLLFSTVIQHMCKEHPSITWNSLVNFEHTVVPVLQLCTVLFPSTSAFLSAGVSINGSISLEVMED